MEIQGVAHALESLRELRCLLRVSPIGFSSFRKCVLHTPVYVSTLRSLASERATASAAASVAGGCVSCSLRRSRNSSRECQCPQAPSSNLRKHLDFQVAIPCEMLSGAASLQPVPAVLPSHAGHRAYSLGNHQQHTRHGIIAEEEAGRNARNALARANAHRRTGDPPRRGERERSRAGREQAAR